MNNLRRYDLEHYQGNCDIPNVPTVEAWVSQIRTWLTSSIFIERHRRRRFATTRIGKFNEVEEHQQGKWWGRDFNFNLREGGVTLLPAALCQPNRISVYGRSYIEIHVLLKRPLFLSSEEQNKSFFPLCSDTESNARLFVGFVSCSFEDWLLWSWWKNNNLNFLLENTFATQFFKDDIFFC